MPPQANISSIRLAVLSVLLVAALGLALGLRLQVVLRILPYPVNCTDHVPVGLGELVALSRELGYPGFQLAYVDRVGQRYECAAGWARLVPWPVRLRANHVMRYASLSKILTSAVAVKLVERGELDLQSRVVDLLVGDVPLADERIAQVTVAQLLRHTGGFDRALTPDPMMAANPWCPADVGKIASVRLDHQPGTVYAYSNLGYCLLGKIIARHEGQSLAEIFRRRLLAPAGVRMTALQRGERLADETEAFFDKEESLSDLLSIDYGAMTATGAWAGNADAFLTLLRHIVGPGADLLSPAQQALLLAAPPECNVGRWRGCHGYGFYRYQERGRVAMDWHDGSLPGATSFAAVTDDGASTVFLANSRHHNWMPDNDRLGLALYRWMGSRARTLMAPP